jgi:DNA-binding GntR family transcriptional regulator
MPVPTRPKAAPRLLLRDVVFDRLRDAIIGGELRPGEVLRDSELEAWAGASRTPVREAIDRLVSTGLVEVRPQRETRVSQLMVDEFTDRLETLAALCVETVREGVRVFEATDVQSVREISAGVAADDVAAVIGELIGAYLRVYGNEVVLRIADGLLPHVRRMVLAEPRFAFALDAAERKSLIAATAHGDADGAASVVEKYFAGLIGHARVVRVSTGVEVR